MDWVLRSPQIHSTFGNLGFPHADGYHINDDCQDVLESILNSILSDEKFNLQFRKSIGFGKNIQKDLIPILINTKNDKIIELLIKILVNLTIPIECLVSVECLRETAIGRLTILEINSLLTSAKAAFTDQRVTKVLIDFLKKNIDMEQSKKLTEQECANVGNSLLLVRNVLHIPEECGPMPTPPPSKRTPCAPCSMHAVQNQILWNLFSQSMDKILIKLINLPESSNWPVTMVQLIALLYKDQHVVTLHNLLNVWLETSIIESSEDNESNTSPPDRGSEDSSPMLTSDPNSDSSDTSGCDNSPGKHADEDADSQQETNPNSPDNMSGTGDESSAPQSPEPAGEQPGPAATATTDMMAPGASSTPTVAAEAPWPSHSQSELMQSSETPMQIDNQSSESCSMGLQSDSTQSQSQNNSSDKNTSGVSDYGYSKQRENQESVSTSSNEDDVPREKPVHQKPHNPKRRVNTKARIALSPQEKRKKIIVKRAKTNIINVQGLSHNTPTDDDISNVLKEFTIDFLLRGYNSLVHTLHTQILTKLNLEIDTSHFFWLVTYFLKFATQIELDLEHICLVLSYDIVAYLTAEAVDLCEQFELAIKLDGISPKPTFRRLHLVVTAIREFIQAIEAYEKMAQTGLEERKSLEELHVKMCNMDELHSLMVLLIRFYNPRYQSKQYLQDLIVTNHILLQFIDRGMALEEYTGTFNLEDHLRKFANRKMMSQYGLLLEGYRGNGEFVNECALTMMQHVGGELAQAQALCQPVILNTFTDIWKADFKYCCEWADIIEYVINKFVRQTKTLVFSSDGKTEAEMFEGDVLNARVVPWPTAPIPRRAADCTDFDCECTKDRWTKSESSHLVWKYYQAKSAGVTDVIDAIVSSFKEDGITKSRNPVIKELYNQNIIDKIEFGRFMKPESDSKLSKETKEDEIRNLSNELIQDGKIKFLEWVQGLLLDICHAKMYLDKKAVCRNSGSKLLTFELFKQRADELPAVSAVAYHCAARGRPVPLVAWDGARAALARDLRALRLLHKLGCCMPVDSGKLFIRVPHSWTPAHCYRVAATILPIHTDKLKFPVNEIPGYDASEATMDGGAGSGLAPPPHHHAPAPDFTPTPTVVAHEAQMEHSAGSEAEDEEEDDDDIMSVVSAQVSSVHASPPPSPPPRARRSPAMLLSDCLRSELNTASVTSDLTHMYVSDEEDNHDDDEPSPLNEPRAASHSAAATEPRAASRGAATAPSPTPTKRARMLL